MTDSNPSVSTNVWTRRGFTALAASGVAGAASAAVKLSPVSSIPMTRRQEAEALRKFAETTHPDDPAASIGAEWRHRADAFVAAADQLDDEGAKSVVADGVLAEAKAAKAASRVRVPIGCTGGATAQLWKEMRHDGSVPNGLSAKDFERLNSPDATAVEIGKIVQKVITAVDKS